MSSFEALDLPENETWQFVRFRNAVTNAILLNLTDRDTDTPFDGQTHLSETGLEVQLPENDGLLNESPCNLIVPLRAGFITDVSSGEPHPDVIVEVWEFTRGEAAAATTLKPFHGLVRGVKRNVSGRRDMVGFSALPVKALLQTVTLGQPCNHHCINRLGDARCKVDMAISNRTINTTLSTVDGTKITVPDAAVPAGKEDRFYERGYVEKDGLQILIVEWRNEIEGTKNEFFLARRPPSGWVGAGISIKSGCDKTIETCKSRYSPIGGTPAGTTGNEANFNGLGYAMPAYHPNFEDGGSRQSS